MGGMRSVGGVGCVGGVGGVGGMGSVGGMSGMSRLRCLCRLCRVRRVRRVRGSVRRLPMPVDGGWNERLWSVVVPSTHSGGVRAGRECRGIERRRHRTRLVRGGLHAARRSVHVPGDHRRWQHSGLVRRAVMVPQVRHVRVVRRE